MVLGAYDGKPVKIKTEWGEVLTGIADVYPSGYGLSEFDRLEESIRIDDVYIFLSDIQNIEILPEDETGATDPRRFDDLMGELLEGPYYIIDRFPKQVPGDDATANRYFPVHHYLRKPERMKVLRRKFAEILLRLNCYHEMAVSFDSCYNWEINPEPEAFADKLENFEGNDFLRVIFEKEGAMIDFEPDDDTCMTLFDPKEHLLELVRQLAASEGFFVWQPPTF